MENPAPEVNLADVTPSKNSRRGKSNAKSSKKRHKDSADEEKKFMSKKEVKTPDKVSCYVTEEESKEDSCVQNLDEFKTSDKGSSLHLNAELGNAIIGLVEGAMDKKILVGQNDFDSDAVESLKKKFNAPVHDVKVSDDLSTTANTDVKGSQNVSTMEADVTISKRSKRGKSKAKNSTKYIQDSAEEKNDLNVEKQLIIKKEETTTHKDTSDALKDELKEDSCVGNLELLKTSAVSSHLHLDPDLGNIIVGVVEGAMDMKIPARQNDCNGDDVEPLKKKFKAPSSGTSALMSNLEDDDSNKKNSFKEKSLEEDQTSQIQRRNEIHDMKVRDDVSTMANTDVKVSQNVSTTEADVTPSKHSKRGKRKAKNSMKHIQDSAEEKNDLDDDKKLIIKKEDTTTDKDTCHASKDKLKEDSCVGNLDEVKTSSENSHVHLDPDLGNVTVGVVEGAMDMKIPLHQNDCNGDDVEPLKKNFKAPVHDVELNDDVSTTAAEVTASKRSKRDKRKVKNSTKHIQDSMEEKNEVDAEKKLTMKKEEMATNKDTCHVSKQELKEDSCVENLDEIKTSDKSGLHLDLELGSVIIDVVEHVMDKKIPALQNDCDSDDVEPLKKKFKAPSSGTSDLMSNLEDDSNEKNSFKGKSFEENQISKMHELNEVHDVKVSDDISTKLNTDVKVGQDASTIAADVIPSKRARRGKRKGTNSTKHIQDSVEETNELDAEKQLIMMKEEITKQELKEDSCVGNLDEVKTSAKNNRLHLDSELGNVKRPAPQNDCNGDDVEPLKKKFKAPSSGISDLVSNIEDDSNKKSSFEEKSFQEDQTSKMQGLNEVHDVKGSDYVSTTTNTDAKLGQDVLTMTADVTPSKRSKGGKRKAKNSTKNIQDSAEEKSDLDAETKLIMKKEETTTDKDTCHVSKQEPKVHDVKVSDDVSTTANTYVKVSQDVSTLAADVGPSKRTSRGKRKDKISLKYIQDSAEEKNDLDAEKKLIMKKEETTADKDTCHVSKPELKSITIPVNSNSSKETATEEDMVESSDEEEEVLSRSSYKNDTDVKVSDQHKNIPTSEVQTKSLKHTLYIGNLPFSVDVSDIEKFFKAAGEIVDIHLPKDPGGSFRGFGFVEFATSEEAMNALNKFSGKKLLGRPVKLNYGKRKSNSSGEKAVQSLQNGGSARVPIVVVCGFNKNDSGDQVRNGLKDHFGSCGEITRVTTPTDHEGELKGIAYIEFKDCNAFILALELNGSKFLSNTLIVDVVNTSRGDGASNDQGGGQSNPRKAGDRFGGRQHGQSNVGNPRGGRLTNGGHSKGHDRSTDGHLARRMNFKAIH